jgi:hypothetical protein
LLGAFGVAIWVHVTCPVLPYDDAFITYRYVDNLVRGMGLVYNDGQRVFGATSPLHVLLLGGLKLIFGSVPTPTLAVRFNFVPYAATGLAIFLTLRRFTGLPGLAALGAAAVLVDPWLLAWSTGGMESYLFSAFLLFGLLAAVAGRPVTAGVLAGLTILTRPEGLLLLLFGSILVRDAPRGLLRFHASAVATLIPWLLFAQIYFGSVIPLSIVAKSRPLYPLPAGYSLWMLLALLDNWVTAASRAPDVIRSILVVAPLYVIPMAVVALGPDRRRGAWAPGAFLGAVVLLYAAGNPLLFEWYLPPLGVLGALSLWISTPRICRFTAAARGRTHAPRSTSLFVWAALTFLVLSFMIYRWTAGGEPSSIVMADPARRRVEAYRTAAEILNRAATGATAVGTPEVGSLGFYFRGRVFDACGLVSPEAHPFLPVPANEREGFATGAISTGFVREARPEFVATMPHFAARSLGKSTWFRANYDVIGRVPLQLPCWGSTEVLLFRVKAGGSEPLPLPDTP